MSNYLYIFVMIVLFKILKNYLTKTFHHLQVYKISHYKVDLYLLKKHIMGTLTIKNGYIYHLRKLLCTHCLNSLMYLVFCIIICISLLCIHHLNMGGGVNWPKYLTTCKSCDFLISKQICIWKITYEWGQFPMKWEIWINLVRYCVHIVSTIKRILHSVWSFVYFCYEYNIWIWRVFAD